jgi:hypothetical protein
MLEGHNFVVVNQVLDRALAQESRSQNPRDLAKPKSNHSSIHFLCNDSDTSDDKSSDAYAAEFS